MTDEFGSPASGRYDTLRAEPEVERDRFGRYMLPDPRHPDQGKRPWTRATTLASSIQEYYNLGRWQQRMVAHGIGKVESLYALAASLDPESDKKQLQQVCEDAMAAAGANRGKELGTALHGFVERIARGGDPMTVPQSWRPFVDAYQIGMDRAGLDVVPDMIERIVICPEIECAGRVDNVLMRNGEHVIGDLKTEKTEEKYDDFSFSATSIAIQLAIYAHASHYWDPFTKTWHQMPDIDQGIAYVMHLPSNAPVDDVKFKVWQVNIRAGWEAVQLCLDVRAWRKRKNLMVPLNVDPSYASITAKLASETGAVESAVTGVGLYDNGQPEPLYRSFVERYPNRCKTCDDPLPADKTTCQDCEAEARDRQIMDETRAELSKREDIKTIEYWLMEVENAYSRDDLSRIWTNYTHDVGPWPAELQAAGAEALKRIDEAEREMAQALEPGPALTAQPSPAPVSPWMVRIRQAQAPADLSSVWRDATAAGEWTPVLEAAGKMRLSELLGSRA